MRVIGCKKVNRSAQALAEALRDYDGRPVNFGNSHLNSSDVINKPEYVALAANKRIALETLTGSDVPNALTYDVTDFPLVGRPDYHSQGKWLRYIENKEQLDRDKRVNVKHPTTHYQRFIAKAREFRVHVVGGHSIKISEKIGITPDQKVKNHRFGSKCVYPYDFNHKKTLRRIAGEAVEALGLDFGAVDILWREDIGFIVLEVNTAPCLTDSHSDTLDRYVLALAELASSRLATAI